MKKLAILDGHLYPEGAYDHVAALCKKEQISFEVLHCRTAQDIIKMAQDMDVCLCNFLPMDGALLDNLPRLKMVVRCGIGIDNLDIDAFTARGVLICNVPDYGVEEVAVHALSLTLALERKIPFLNAQTHAGIWNDNLGYDVRRLSNRVLGFLGFGRTAQHLAFLSDHLYKRYIAFDPYAAASLFEKVESVDLDTLFSEADTLIVMAPATEETHHIVNVQQLAKAKKGLRLINVSRGNLVDMDAVTDALDQGILAAAAFDVLESEPATAELLAKLNRDDIVLTPHTAYRSVESVEALKTMAAQTAIWFMKGNRPYHVMNSSLLEDGDK